MGRKKKWKKWNDHNFTQEQMFSEEEKDGLKHHFEKIYTYSIPKHEEWNLPKEHLFQQGWKDLELMKLKKRLNDVKSYLSDIEINTWHFHTTSMNQAGLIVSSVKRDYGPEMCTQAWCKFHEILCNFSLFDLDEQHPLNTLHLCEAPGAFITSLNHYIKTRNPYIQWNWLANTLNPHYEGNSQSDMIADDSFAMNTLQHWYFGIDNTGNVMSKPNLEDLIEKVNISGKFHLVTADGSVDCANNPAEQESITSQIHYCELVTSLFVLEKGGCLVMKMFTLLEESSISILYIMCCSFEVVTVFKPVTSKPGNSEVYIVCQKYLGMQDDVLQTLQYNFGVDQDNSAILSHDALPKSYLEQHRECCFQFCNYQIETIERNQRTFNVELSPADKEVLEKGKLCFQQIFKETCKMRRLANNDRIVPFRTQVQNHARLKENYVLRKPHIGSFVERQRDKEIEWKERVKTMKITPTSTLLDNYPLLLQIDKTQLTYNCKHWNVVLGMPYIKVHSSRFCHETLLRQYNDFLENMDFQKMNTSRCGITNTDQDTCENIMQHLNAKRILNVCGDSSRFEQYIDQESLNKKEEGIPPTVLHVVEGLIELKERGFPVNHNYLFKCIQLLQDMKKGDCLLLQQDFVLTRMGVGLHYILHILFENVKFFIPRDGSVPWIYILCLDFICDRDKTAHGKKLPGKNNGSEDLSTVSHRVHLNSYDILSYLKNVSGTYDTLHNDKDQAVLEFVPMNVLYDLPFYTEMCWLNDQLLRRRINYMIKHANSDDCT